MQNYTVYHLHTDLSSGVTNIDSVTKYHQYVNKAKELGMTALAFSEHGSVFEWWHKKQAVEKAGMKYIHAIETYVTETIAEKQRDNYHCVLIAKNKAGFEEINRLSSIAFNREDGHFYYHPRITLDELIGTSDNIIITTACLGGILNHAQDKTKAKFINFLEENKHRCYLEIQHHNVEDQITYNQYLYDLSFVTGVPLIAGTDTHALNDEHLDARKMLQKSKNVLFANEDNWDLTFKSYDELVEAYQKQDALPQEVYLEAIENTNRMADQIEEFDIDTSAKYPKLYEDSEKVFKKKINEGAKRRGVNKYDNYDEYKKRVQYEYDTYKFNNAIDFMLLEEDYKSEMRKRGINCGYSRGSVSGSIIAYLLGITEIDSIKHNLNFERFMNTERVSLADIDTDWYSEDRDVVKKYLFQKHGLYCCDIITFNTIAVKGAVRDICRGIYKANDVRSRLDEYWQKEYDSYYRSVEHYNGQGQSMPMPANLKREIDKANGNYLDISNRINKLIDEDKEDVARKEYPIVFKYVDIVQGVIVSVGNHPAGLVVSPVPIDEWFGTFYSSTNKYPISQINMKEIDSLNFVKLDILSLDNIGLIDKTCELAGIERLVPENTPGDDIAVWESIRDDTTMIFQWESESASHYLRRLLSDETIEKIRAINPDFTYMDLLSIGNGAIRPAGASYREQLATGTPRDNGHPALNEFLASTIGFLVFQEQVIQFLHQFCGYSMGQADIVRRHFAKKTGTEEDIPMIKAGFNKTMKEKYSISDEEADELIVNFIQVIEDASSYLFSLNHSDPYSWIGYICGYLRYHYPYEFITTALNIFEDKEDKTLKITEYAHKQGIKIESIKFRYSQSEYAFNKETKTIYKGMNSIKYLNKKISKELYNLGKEQFADFYDLLKSLKHTSVNSRQLEILIKLDFFSEFGNPNQLLAQVENFNNYYGRKQLSKSDITESDVKKIRYFAEKETEKQFKIEDFMKLIRLMDNTVAIKTSMSERIKYEGEHLGYISIVIPDIDSSYASVMKIDGKYKNKNVTLYRLSDGTQEVVKVKGKSLEIQPLEEGDIIRTIECKEDRKWRKGEDGFYQTDEKEIVLTKWKEVE